MPFGIDPTPPQPGGNVIKGVVLGIAQDDTLLLWGGGIWDWLDPLTVIRAMASLRERRPDIKLFFLGLHHPQPSRCAADADVRPGDRAGAAARPL